MSSFPSSQTQCVPKSKVDSWLSMVHDRHYWAGVFYYVVCPAILFYLFAPGLIFSFPAEDNCDTRVNTVLMPGRVTWANAAVAAVVFMGFLWIWFWLGAGGPNNIFGSGILFPFHVRIEM